MAKLNLTNVTSGFSPTAAINANNDRIKVAMENTLSRDGTGPNQMNAPLDMNGNMILNQANPITVSGFNWKGPWITGATYSTGDVVQNNSSSYICIVTHTSSALFATDLAAGKWQVVASSASLPSQAGNANKILATDGANAYWSGVSSLALPIGGGTLTGPLIGTSGAFGGSMSAQSLTVSGASYFSSINASGLITPTSTVGIKGTVAADEPAAGSIGETIFVGPNYNSPVAYPSTSQWTTVISYTLPAGDWDVDGSVFIKGNGTILTQIFGTITETPATFNENCLYAFYLPSGATIASAQIMGQGLPRIRYNRSTPTTIYLQIYVNFSGPVPMGAYGKIFARRIR